MNWPSARACFRGAESLAGKGSTKKAVAIYDQLRAMHVAAQVRLAAWRGAILNRGKEALPLLLTALDSGDFALSAAAMRISQELPGTEVTLALAKRLPKLRQEDQQLLLAQTLGRRGDAAALPALFAAADKGASAVRLAAIRALPDIGHPAAVPVLLELMGDPDSRWRRPPRKPWAACPGQEADAAVMNLLARGTVSPAHHRDGPRGSAPHDFRYPAIAFCRRGFGAEAPGRRFEDLGRTGRAGGDSGTCSSCLRRPRSRPTWKPPSRRSSR